MERTIVVTIPSLATTAEPARRTGPRLMACTTGPPGRFFFLISYGPRCAVLAPSTGASDGAVKPSIPFLARK